MSKVPDVYSLEWHLNVNEAGFGQHYSEGRIVDFVLGNSVDMLEQKLQEIRDNTAHQEVAQYADHLLAEFIRHRVLDGFREVEKQLRAEYERRAEAQSKWEKARLSTKDAVHYWETQANELRSMLSTLEEWVHSPEVSPKDRFSFADELPGICILPSKWLKNPADFVKNRASFYEGINFIYAKSEYEAEKMRWERPVRMSVFELSLKALEAAQFRVKECQNEEAAAKEVLCSLTQKCQEKRHQARMRLKDLSGSGRAALSLLVYYSTELFPILVPGQISPTPGVARP